MEIENHQEVKLHNLLSYRQKIREEDIDNEFAEMAAFIDMHELNQIGGVITTVHKMDKETNLLDMEIMIPIEHQTTELSKYTIKPLFHLINALYLSYQGNPSHLSNAHEKIFQYVAQNKLQPITPLYNFYSNKIEEAQSIEELKVDLLIGINPSVL